MHIHFFGTFGVYVSSEDTIWCVCLNTNIILQVSFFISNNMPGLGVPFLAVIIVFYSIEWKITFINRHFPLIFDVINRAAVNGLLSFFPSLCPLRCVS